jgi:putative transposase
MGYPPRIVLVNRAYHVMSNGVEDCDIYRDDEDREVFLTYLDREVVRSEWDCFGYSLMDTHFHTLIELAAETLSSGMQHLKSTYARYFNRKYGRRGALWRSRFTGVLVETDAQMLETTRYIANNALAAGMCDKPEDHVWCNYGAAVGVAPPDRIVNEGKLLGLFAVDRNNARERLREFVEEKDPRRRRFLEAAVSDTSQRRVRGGSTLKKVESGRMENAVARDEGITW